MGNFVVIPHLCSCNNESSLYAYVMVLDTNVGAHSTMVELGTSMWVDAGSNTAQAEMVWTVLRS